jgi:hypothetical protein
VFLEGNKNMVHPESPPLSIPLSQNAYRFSRDTEPIEKAFLYDATVCHFAVLPEFRLVADVHSLPIL